MPVQYFRTFEEAERALWHEPGDPRILPTLRFVCSWDALLPQYPLPRGVQKFRSIEEANAAREAWETARIRFIREQRLTGQGQSQTNAANRDES